MVNEDELRALARKWAEEAMSYVPAEYAERGLHSKYLKLDNYASGLDDCAIQLLELLDPRSPTLREPVAPIRGTLKTCPSCGADNYFSGANCVQCEKPFHS